MLLITATISSLLASYRLVYAALSPYLLSLSSFPSLFLSSAFFHFLCIASFPAAEAENYQSSSLNAECSHSSYTGNGSEIANPLTSWYQFLRRKCGVVSTQIPIRVSNCGKYFEHKQTFKHAYTLTFNANSTWMQVGAHPFRAFHKTKSPKCYRITEKNRGVFEEWWRLRGTKYHRNVLCHWKQSLPSVSLFYGRHKWHIYNISLINRRWVELSRTKSQVPYFPRCLYFVVWMTFHRATFRIMVMFIYARQHYPWIIWTILRKTARPLIRSYFFFTGVMSFLFSPPTHKQIAFYCRLEQRYSLWINQTECMRPRWHNFCAYVRKWWTLCLCKCCGNV